MSSTGVLPSVEEIKELLTTMLDLDVEVRSTTKQAPKDDVVAVYVDGEGGVKAACVANVVAAACIGAALTRFPASTAETAASRRTLDGGLLDNVHEVMNIAAQLLRNPESGRVALDEVYLPDEPRPQSAHALLASPAARLDVIITISNYPSGLLSLLVVDPPSA